jgi:multiple sugar transport system substrate-binding protein
MRRYMVICLAAALLLLPGLIFAGGGQEKKTAEEKVVTVFASSKAAADNTWKLRNDAFEKETGIRVDLQMVPGSEEEFFDKTDIAVLEGDTTDTIRLTNPLNTAHYVGAGFLLPLDDLLKKAGYNAEAVFGKFLKRIDGKLYYLPYEQSVHAVYYNKKIFKDAGVPYPKAPWTWDDYTAIAKKLTNKDKGVYGSYFVLDWEYYYYMIARQRGVSGYKANGSSNFADPAFKEALKFMFDLGETHKAQPTYKEYLANKYGWDTWAATGKFGMICIGSWFTGLLTDSVTYPRDWDWGIVETPAAGPNGKNNLMAGGVWAVLKKAKHPQNAVRYITYVSENWYKAGGGIPARINLTAQEIQGILGGIAEKSNGSVSVSDLDAALLHNTLGVVDEKITGPKAKEYTDVILREAQLYMSGAQSVDDAVKNITSQGDKILLSK